MFFKPEDAVNFKDDDKRRVLEIVAASGFKQHGGVITVPVAQACLDYIANCAINRDFPWWKKMRPHDTIEYIRNFKPPAGDYSVGVEHETYVRGDDDIQARKEIVEWLANEPYVCVDSDGAMGATGAKVMLEATFPPVLASECNLDWAAARYVKFLGDKKLVKKSTPETVNVGVHINMAKGGQGHKWWKYSHFGYLTEQQCKKYFGRKSQVSLMCRDNHAGNKWVEFRMFNTTTDPHQMLWYVEVSKLLIDIMDKGNEGEVKLADVLEEAYVKFFGAAAKAA